MKKTPAVTIEFSTHTLEVALFRNGFADCELVAGLLYNLWEVVYKTQPVEISDAIGNTGVGMALKRWLKEIGGYNGKSEGETK